MTWLDHVRGDPLPWLLFPDTPAVRAAALQRLLDLAPDSAEVRQARHAAMDTDPIKAILAAQDPAGWWVKPGPGYGPKYLGTVWQVIFLDQLSADGSHPQVARACDYVLDWRPCSSGAFAASAVRRQAPPSPSAAVHCLNGNLLRALIGFGRLDDERVEAAIQWAARAITGEGMARWYASGTSGPGFACAANEQQPCAWGALKELSALARIPRQRRTPLVRRAIEMGVAFLFSRDPAVADYPMGWGNTKPSNLVVSIRVPDRLRIRRAADPGGARRARPRRGPAANPGTGLGRGRPGRPGSMEEPVRVQRQDLGGHRAPGTSLHMGHLARLPVLRAAYGQP